MCLTDRRPDTKEPRIGQPHRAHRAIPVEGENLPYRLVVLHSDQDALPEDSSLWAANKKSVKSGVAYPGTQNLCYDK